MFRPVLPAAIVATGVFLGCSGAEPPAASVHGDAGAEVPDAPDDPIEGPCDDDDAAIYGDPGFLPPGNGQLLRCMRAGRLSAKELEAKLAANGVVSPKLRSGARVYKLTYRTERGSVPIVTGVSSALVFLPDAPRAGILPRVVFAHGSRGQGPDCAPSKADPKAEFVRADFENATYPLVGAGLAVIAPDGAGYANFGAPGNPPSGYAAAADVAKSTLDAARALGEFAPKLVGEKVVLVGHSQGGHSALSALAYWKTHAPDLAVAATVVYAPLWVSQRWGAVLFTPDDFPFRGSAGTNVAALLYHYTQGELLDGPGAGLDPFLPEKRAGVKAFVEGSCWAKQYDSLEVLGTNSRDIYRPEFVEAVASVAALGGECDGPPEKKALCEKWLARYRADRPALEAEAAAVPLMIVSGDKDATIPPSRLACVRDWLARTGGSPSYCVDPDGDHSGVVRNKAEWVSAWIAARTMGEAEPPACSHGVEAITAPCNGLPPNE
jgi:pimeloyl-ACP methyl ester carboxylesterase